MRDSSMAGLAKVLSKDTNIRVTISGEVSCIDHDGNINIARMPDTPVGRMLTTGLVFHEISHKNHSCLTSKPPGLLGNIANIIEDIWTEGKTIVERPGTRFNLAEVTTHYANSGKLEPENIQHAICGKAMAYGRRAFLSQLGMKVIEEKCEEMMEDAFGSDFVIDLEAILADIPIITNSSEAIDVAKRIEQLVVNQKPKPQPKTPVNPNPRNTPQQGEEENGTETATAGSGSSEENEQQAAGTGPEDGDIDDQPQNATGQQPSEEDEQEEQSGQTPGGTGHGGKASLTEQEIEDLLSQESDYGDLSRLITKEIDSLAVDPADVASSFQPLLPVMSKDTMIHRKLDEVSAISASSKMRAKMMGMLQDIKRCPESYGASGKKLSAKRLVKIAFGDPRIFTRKKEVKAANTAVVIAIDYSGSMCSSVRISNPAAFAIHHALHGLNGTAIASIGFGCCCEAKGDQRILTLVGFKEKPISSKFNLPAQGGTPTHEAIWSARAMLLERAEPRKIILIVTDGDPDNRQSTKAATSRTEKDGIEIAAIGINTSCVKHLWKTSKCIDDIKDLPEAMFTVMNGLLVGKA